MFDRWEIQGLDKMLYEQIEGKLIYTGLQCYTQGYQTLSLFLGEARTNLTHLVLVVEESMQTPHRKAPHLILESTQDLLALRQEC